jgi:hypothetical protein
MKTHFEPQMNTDKNNLRHTGEAGTGSVVWETTL